MNNKTEIKAIKQKRNKRFLLSFIEQKVSKGKKLVFMHMLQLIFGLS